MFCTSCAASNGRSVGHCQSCGADLSAMPERATASPRRTALTTDHGTLRTGLVSASLTVVLAVIAFTVLSIRDSAADRASAYQRGLNAVAAGDLVVASAAFTDAGGYRDARLRRLDISAQLRSYDAAYVDGVVALADKRFDEAITALLPVVRDLPNYRDSADLLEEARVGREAALLRTAYSAMAGQDWKAAEDALAMVVADDPDNEAAVARLQEIRRQHAPVVFSRDHRIYTVGPDLANERLVTGEVAAAWPVWSPDRQRITFISPDSTTSTSIRRLYVVDADGRNLRQLAAGVRPYAWPVWSPDGNRIAYTGESFGATETSGAWTVNVVDLTTGVMTDLTTGVLPNATSPTWSPEGTRLAFVKRRAIGSGTAADDGPLGGIAVTSSEIYVFSFVSGKMDLVGGDVPDPWRIAWSPVADQMLVYSRADGTSYTRGSIYLLNVASGELATIDTTTQDISPPVWSPDGRSFAYVKRGLSLRVITIDEGEIEISAAERLSRFLSWAPSGDAIIVAADSPAVPSQILNLAGDVPRWSPVAIRYDLDGIHAGPPQWSALNPVAAPTTPTYGGTALDRTNETASST